MAAKMTANDHVEFWKRLETILTIKSSSEGNSKGCILWEGPPSINSVYGKQRIEWFDGKITFEGAHWFAFLVKNRLTPSTIPKFTEKGDILEISHLCHNALCVNTDHLVLETHAINKEHAHCKKQHLCMKCHDGPDCII